MQGGEGGRVAGPLLFLLILFPALFLPFNHQHLPTTPTTSFTFPPPHPFFFLPLYRLRQKGVINLNGEVLRPAMLSYQEEELVGNSELLIKLVEHGVILPSY